MRIVDQLLGVVEGEKYSGFNFLRFANDSSRRGSIFCFRSIRFMPGGHFWVFSQVFSSKEAHELARRGEGDP